MCQLTLVNTKNKYLNSNIATVVTAMNSDIHNKDGAGFIIPGENGEVKMYKTLIPPSLSLNLTYNLLQYLINSKRPLLAHVRQATFTNGLKSVDLSNTHPFETKKLIVAHNGSLSTYDPEVMKEKRFEGMIDSQIFATLLDEIYTEGKSLADALKETMLLFYGKFAFIIFDKTQNKYFVVKGKTANLHYFPLEIISSREDDGKTLGCIINTERDSLAKALILWSSLYSSKTGKFLRLYDVNKIESLEAESIFEFNENGSKLVKIDEIKETYKPVNTYQNNKNYDGREYWNNRGGEQSTLPFSSDGGTNTGVATRTEVEKMEAFFGNWLEDFSDEFDITFQYLNLMATEYLQKSLLEMDAKDYKNFCSMLKKIDEPSKELKNAWSSLNKMTWLFPFDYDIHNLVVNKEFSELARKELDIDDTMLLEMMSFPWMFGNARIYKFILEQDENLYKWCYD